MKHFISCWQLSRDLTTKLMWSSTAVYFFTKLFWVLCLDPDTYINRDSERWTTTCCVLTVTFETSHKRLLHSENIDDDTSLSCRQFVSALSKSFTISSKPDAVLRVSATSKSWRQRAIWALILIGRSIRQTHFSSWLKKSRTRKFNRAGGMPDFLSGLPEI